VSELFGISISALQAFQTAISVTGNNIANANTPGYARESVDLSAATPQADGGVFIGSGVDVSGITRAVDALSNSQLNSSQSSLGQLNSLQTYTNQLDNIVGTTAGGLTTALQNYYNAWSTVANDPTSTAARQALIGQAQSVASAFQTTNTQLQGLNTSINSNITSDVTHINSLAASISSLNTQIVVGTAQDGGQPPNELLDQRDAALSSLSQLVGVTTSTDSNGALNVFVGNGQPLVLQGSTSQLSTVQNPFNASQLEISTTTSGGNIISSQITSGDLGGLLAARTQGVNPAINQLGQIATALSSQANTQQNSGLDLNGSLGANLFSVAAPVATASSRNTGTASATVSIANPGALTTDNYVLGYTAGTYSLTDATTGAAVALSGSGTVASPFTAAGVSIVVSGAPASGDQFLIQPTAQAAGSFNVALTNPTQIAAAGAVLASAAAANTGSGTISSGTVITPTNPNLLATASIQFTSATTYEINGAGSYPYTAGANITQNGWQVQISGSPATGDVFTVQNNVGGTGDNRNALASANQQTQGVLSNGTTSVNAATSAWVTAIGSQAQQVNTQQTAQSAVNSQALSQVQSVSGVNLDEEAANLLKWQQAYQASAQALSIGNSTFTTLMDAINGTTS
jgi:flagellar hook-associated protein 1 FlgK